MIDIDRKLKSLNIDRHTPSETLRSSTRTRCASQAQDEMQHTAHKAHRPLRLRWAIPAAALAVAVLMLIAIVPFGTVQAAGYYTVDINPSISFEVDSGDVVLAVTAENDDAADLLQGLDLAGMPFTGALRTVVQAASASGYLAQDGHVLIAHFGDGEGISQQQAQNIVQGEAGSTVRVLAMNTNRNRFEHANGEESAGMKLLREQAREQGVSADDAEALIDEMRGKKEDKQQDKQQSKDTPTDESPGNSGNAQNDKPDKPEKDTGSSSENAPGQQDKQDKQDKSSNGCGSENNSAGGNKK